MLIDVIYGAEPSIRPHFDTDHLATVPWDPANPQDAANRLQSMIRATRPTEPTLENLKARCGSRDGHPVPRLCRLLDELYSSDPQASGGTVRRWNTHASKLQPSPTWTIRTITARTAASANTRRGCRCRSCERTLGTRSLCRRSDTDCGASIVDQSRLSLRSWRQTSAPGISWNCLTGGLAGNS